MPKNTTVEYDITPEFHMILPASGAFTGADRSQDVTAERIKGRKGIPLFFIQSDFKKTIQVTADYSLLP